MVALAGQSAEIGRRPVPALEGQEQYERARLASGGRARPRLTTEQIEAMVNARRSGSQIGELADEFGVHRSTVLAHLDRAGVPGRRWAGRALDTGELRAAAAMYESGRSLVAVGERFDVDKRYLSRVLRDQGVAVRRPGRSR